MYDRSYDACPRHPPITKAGHVGVASARPCSSPHMSTPVWMTGTSSHLPSRSPETHTLCLILGSPTQPVLHTANPLMVPIALSAKPSPQNGSQAPTQPALSPLQTQISLLPCPLPSSPCSQPLYFSHLTFTPFSTNFVAICYIPVTVLSTQHLLKAFNPHNSPVKACNIFGCIIFCRMES